MPRRERTAPAGSASLSNAPGGPSLGRLRRLIADMQRGREEQATYRALAALDTRTLRDIGLDRSEIRSVARELADRHATRVHAQQSLRDRA